MSSTNGTQASALSNLASIIIPCCGMLEYTKLLVPSLLEYTRQPYELIFLDIGSLDGTAEYLTGLAAGVRHCRVTVVHAETDLQIPEACRQALGTAAGEYVVLLNNDTIVSEHWLDMLVALTQASELNIHLAGPMSNYAAEPQLVQTVPYRLGVESGVWGVESGEWRVESGGSRVESGGWRVEGGARPAFPVPRCALHPPRSTLHSPRSTLSPEPGASNTRRNGSPWTVSAASVS